MKHTAIENINNITVEGVRGEYSTFVSEPGNWRVFLSSH